MVALSNIPDAHRLFMQLEANNRALDVLGGDAPGMVVSMVVQASSEGQSWGTESLDTREMPGQESLVAMLIDIINWRQYLIKEALQGLGVDTDPPTQAETAAFNSHQMTQRQRRK